MVGGKRILGGGDAAHTMLMGNNWGGDTAQHSKKKSFWLGGWMNPSGNIAPSCKLKLARFSALLRIQDGAECGNIPTINH